MPAERGYEEHAEHAARRLAGIVDLMPTAIGAPATPRASMGGPSMPGGWQHPVLARIAARHPPEDPPRPRLKVPKPGESMADRLFGRDYVLPEEAASVVMEMGPGPVIKAAARALGIGAAKEGLPHTRLTPGGGLGAHEGEELGHTLARHVGWTVDG